MQTNFYYMQKLVCRGQSTQTASLALEAYRINLVGGVVSTSLPIVTCMPNLVYTTQTDDGPANHQHYDPL